MLDFLLVLLLAGGPAREIFLDGPIPPSRVTVTVSAVCEGQPVLVRYARDNPGLDLFSAISVNGVSLDSRELGRLNDMLGNYSIGTVDVIGCEGTGARYEAQLRVTSYRGDQGTYVIGVRNGTFRTIRQG